MALLQLIGYATFILASLVLGIRLLSLWRRTRELPELAIGAAFLLGGGLGYTSWLVLGVLAAGGGSPQTIKGVAMVGLAFTVLGALCNGVGTARIFRPGKLWARAWVACVGFGMAACYGLYAGRPAGESAPEFWRTVLVAAPFYVWGAAEAISLGRSLRKRARIGLADPLIADRIVKFGTCNAAVVVSIAVSYSAQLVYGAAPPAWTSALASAALVVGAGAIWLGFFPPAAYRARIEATPGAV